VWKLWVLRLVESEGCGEMRAYGADYGTARDGFGEESGWVGGGRGHGGGGGDGGGEGIVVIQNNDRREIDLSTAHSCFKKAYE
jgi:hypothetical protein